MVTESQLEKRVVRHLDVLDCEADTPYLRRCTMGQGFGAIDLLVLPAKGRKRLILVEAKRISSADATCKVIGQLVMYYAAALRLGSAGITKLRQFAEEQPARARSKQHKSLQALAGGVKGAEKAAGMLGRGARLKPSQIGLYIVLDKQPGDTLTAVVKALAKRHRLKIQILVASQRPVTLRPAGADGGTRRLRGE